MRNAAHMRYCSRNGAQEREIAQPPDGGCSVTRRQPNVEVTKRRINAGLTPPVLAARAGISANTVRAAERGLYVDPRSQFAIARELDADVLELFPFETQKVPK